MAQYIYRLDDITPNMNWKNFFRYIELFNHYKVVPLIGIVPDNKDYKLCKNESNDMFWDIMCDLKSKGVVEIAQHGYQHLYGTRDEGILKSKFGYKLQSEFSGLNYEVQYNKIKRGKEILIEKKLDTDIFMAPSHSFDKITIQALRDLRFKYITDGIGFYPYEENGITCIPQQFGTPRKFPFGVITICLHPNDSDEIEFNKVRKHLDSRCKFIKFSEACSIRGNKVINKIFSRSFLVIKYIKCKIVTI